MGLGDREDEKVMELPRFDLTEAGDEAMMVLGTEGIGTSSGGSILGGFGVGFSETGVGAKSGGGVSEGVPIVGEGIDISSSTLHDRKGGSDMESFSSKRFTGSSMTVSSFESEIT